MLEDLEIGEAEPVEPTKLARKKEALPFNIASEWDKTPLGEARQVLVRPRAGIDIAKVGSLLLRLVRLYAKSQGLVAFKATATPNDEGLVLYWQKKPGRRLRPAVEPAILPKPDESIAKPKKEKGGVAT